MARFLPGLLPMLRGLRNQPGFALLAIITLALGIGVNVAIFSALEAVVINPLPFPDAHRLASVYEDASWIGYAKNTPSPANFMDWKREAKSFVDIGATSSCRAILTGEGASEEAACRNMTANMWPLLGVKPILGRWFTAAEDHPQPNVVMIGEGLWTRRYGRDPAIINRTIQIEDNPMQVVGVMPAWFRFPDDKEVWLPIGFTPQQIAQRGSHYLRCFGRLKPGISITQASAELLTIQKRLNKAYPSDLDSRTGAGAEPLQDSMVGNTRSALWILMGAAAMVLLIACANVANLLLARATGRQRELAVRSALGASTGDLLGHVFLETLVLTTAGGALGLWAAQGSRTLLEFFIPEGLRSSVSIGLDATVLAFAFLMSFLAALLASATPAIHILRTPLMNLLRQDSRAGTGRGAVRMRAALVVSEVALTVTLLAGAGLMIRSLMAIWNTDIGFRPDHLMSSRVSLPGRKYQDDQKRFQFYSRTLERIRTIPGIAAADFASTPPFFSIGNSRGFAVEGRTPPARWEESDMLTRVGTPGYLQTLGARLAEGRFFTDADREGALDVAIVNESFARTFFPNSSAIGKRMSFSAPKLERRWRTIVGVVREIKERGYDYAPKPVTYIPVRQGEGYFAGELVVRSQRGSPEQFLNAIRQAIQAEDPDQPIGVSRTFDQILALDQANRRQQMFLLAAFSALSLLMACLGIYAILAYTVELRRQEIGVRMALGANRSDVMRLVAADGLKLAAGGGVLGIAIALAGAQVLSASLYGVKPFDPVTMGAVCGVLIVTAIFACWIPALRAARTEPVKALRS